jgi:hypothetical protein
MSGEDPESEGRKSEEGGLFLYIYIFFLEIIKVNYYGRAGP